MSFIVPPQDFIKTFTDQHSQIIIGQISLEVKQHAAKLPEVPLGLKGEGCTFVSMCPNTIANKAFNAYIEYEYEFNMLGDGGSLNLDIEPKHVVFWSISDTRPAYVAKRVEELQARLSQKPTTQA